MITLHRLGHPEELVLNSDLVLTIEANPDTAITLVTGNRLMVSESPAEVIEAIRAWRTSVGGTSLGGVAAGVPKLV